MKDSVISGEELFVHFREGIIVSPQLKQILFQSSTSHKKSSLVVFHHSQRERERCLFKQSKENEVISTNGRCLLVFTRREPQLSPPGGVGDSGWQEWRVHWRRQGEHRMNTHPSPYLSLNEQTCCKHV